MPSGALYYTCPTRACSCAAISPFPLQFGEAGLCHRRARLCLSPRLSRRPRLNLAPRLNLGIRLRLSSPPRVSRIRRPPLSPPPLIRMLRVTAEMPPLIRVKEQQLLPLPADLQPQHPTVAAPAPGVKPVD